MKMDSVYLAEGTSGSAVEQVGSIPSRPVQ